MLVSPLGRNRGPRPVAQKKNQDQARVSRLVLVHFNTLETLRKHVFHHGAQILRPRILDQEKGVV